MIAIIVFIITTIAIVIIIYFIIIKVNQPAVYMVLAIFLPGSVEDCGIKDNIERIRIDRNRR